MYSPNFVHTPESLKYAVTHVFLSLDLPDRDDYTVENDLSLARAVCAAAHAYTRHIYGTSEEVQWRHVTKMLDSLETSARLANEHLDNLKDHIIYQVRGMEIGDILSFYIRPQNAAVIVTKKKNRMLCESFEVIQSGDTTSGVRTCSYPSLAAEIPIEAFDENLQHELANYLSCPNAVDSDFTTPPSTTPVHHSASLLSDIGSLVLSGGGLTVDAPSITKHVRHEANFGWRRSLLFLLIKVVIQLSIARPPFGLVFYKKFMLFFICTLAGDPSNAHLSSDQLHNMSSKIFVRLSKLETTPLGWLSDFALKTCESIGNVLDAQRERLCARPSPFRNPPQDELVRDSQLSLLHSRDYIQKALSEPCHEVISTPFRPSHHRRGTIGDFLSSHGTFFDEAYRIDPGVTLYDVEQSVELDLDDWLACVMDVDGACKQIVILLDKYMHATGLCGPLLANPEDTSIQVLTVINLFVALDKLVVKEVPMLADYSPEIPLALMEKLLLHKATSLHHLSCAYQYLSARHSRSRPGWSVLWSNFTDDSFPVRYFDQSPHFQQLKARIEEDIMKYQQHQTGEQFPWQYLLPLSPLHGKTIVFELQCPAYVRNWRSAASCVLRYFESTCIPMLLQAENILLPHQLPKLQNYFVGNEVAPLFAEFCLVYLFPSIPHSSGPMLLYVIRHLDGTFSLLRLCGLEQLHDFPYSSCYLQNFLDRYTNSTSHTSNVTFAAQADCPADLSLDEFNAFAHLRSGGSLQWLNILRGLRSRTLNLRHRDVHLLIARATYQVGPLDLNTGAWIWHQELQEPSFCNSLLDELESLFADVGTHLIDGVLMNTISLLLTRVLASNPSKGVSERAIKLLQKVRRKTFSWVQELLYDLGVAPTSEERKIFLLGMAATCRSTFNVDPITLSSLFHSAEDVDVLLSCAFLTRTLHSKHTYVRDTYTELLVDRDRRLSLVFERALGNVLVVNPSDYGIDLAVGKIFANYRPGVHRWEQLHDPNERWFICENELTVDRPWKTVHINLVDGTLRLDGRLLGGLPDEIKDSLPEACGYILRDQGFFVLPSNLPGMDYTTCGIMSECKVHFSLKDSGNLVVQAEYHQTNTILRLIPSYELQDDLPLSLVEGHVHWLNMSTRMIEIRPYNQLWEHSAEQWTVDCSSVPYYYGYRGRDILVDIQSPTWEMVSACFKCLHSADTPWRTTWHRNLLVTVSPHESSSVHSTSMLQLSVTLPCYGLFFFVNGFQELESRDFKDMVYDESQCIGTLLGLKNLLVLRPKARISGVPIPEGLIHRRVLVPNGHPTRESLPDGDNHVKVTRAVIKPLSGRDGSLYHTYVVDTDLGCLIGSGSLTSMRLLAYLHATTSFHFPDPLTGKTGTEAALCLLRSAGCRSIMKLKAFDDNPDWTRYDNPQISAAYNEILKRYYWNREASGIKVVAESNAFKLPDSRSDYAARQISSEDNDSRFGRNDQLASGQITLGQLLRNRFAPELPARSVQSPRNGHNTSPNDISALDQLFSSLQTNASYQREYLAHLEASAQRVRMEARITHQVVDGNLIEGLKRHFVQCRAKYLEAMDILKKSLGPTTDPQEQALHRFGQWQPTTADVLLRCLASTSPIEIPASWKKCLISLALLLLDLQRARRLLRFALERLVEELKKELENEGYDGWSPDEYPDWLLIQIQGNFLIRRNQAETARAIMSPPSGGNTVIQVNMGEGKSSVVVPIAAAALADGKQLVRVVVPKALGVQMFELLVSRLGGLTNRPIYHLPFSRTPEYDHGGNVVSLQIDDLHTLMTECMTEGGILLTQPEHVASLKLMSVEEQIREGKLTTQLLPKLQKLIRKHVMTAMSLKSLSQNSFVNSIFRCLSESPNSSIENGAARVDCHDDGDEDVLDDASKWLDLQKWLHSHARDILDESDETLHPRFQLIYAIGSKQHVDGCPGRWTITQQVLQSLKKHIFSVSRYAPESIEYECGPPGSFPLVRIMRGSHIRQRLASLIVEDVMAGQLPTFYFDHLPSPLRDAIRGFISDEEVLQVPDTVKRVEEYVKRSDQDHLWSGLLLLRGLLTSNVLWFALSEKRWRVDYGLVLQPQSRKYPESQTTTMLAVPYRAKDMPASSTQFSHPDLTIILTCLSYYYAGLTEEQLRVSFEILLDQDDPFTEYAFWVKEHDHELLSDSLRNLSDINLRSSEQWDNIIFPLFSRNQAAIDFYLARVVFPKEMKEFPWKLSASSCDLGEKREKLTTGFSGTNDGRWLLPMSVTQYDLDHQRGTNARVLAYLLQPENDFYVVTHENGKRLNTLELLWLITSQQPEIRVLLDVGAQILDLSNQQVAQTWLDNSHDTAGAIYFNENDELTVLARNDISQPLSSSPLSQQLDHCVVYLDHAHTRGTDLKFPTGSRAAVTLGPKVTKDALVQGCMRMRKLGHGHSVMFFAPHEVDQSIRIMAGKEDPTIQVTTMDILCWAIHETWIDIQQRAPYWAQQGMNHKTRYDAWTQFCNNNITAEQLSDAWLQSESKALVDLYAPRKVEDTSGTLSAPVPEILQRCKDLGVLSLPSAQMDEEHEREVKREREREREVELPPPAEPANHHLHQDVVSFVKTGIIPSLKSSSAFIPVFTTLEMSSAAALEADVWNPLILATVDFCCTIKPESTRGTMDEYLRPVQWVLSRSTRTTKVREQVLVLLSPFEADCLMPYIRASEHVHLHLYAPRTSQRMKPSDDLQLYSIPPVPSDWTPPWDLIDQLNVFAGQLYLRDYKSYLRLCRFLSVPTQASPDGPAIRRNLFEIPGSFEEMEITFSGSPLPSVMALLAMRNRGRPFTHAHMGKILQGQLLTQKDFERPVSGVPEDT